MVLLLLGVLGGSGCFLVFGGLGLSLGGGRVEVWGLVWMRMGFWWVLVLLVLSFLRRAARPKNIYI